MKKIIVHGATAHMDEVVAAGLLLIVHPGYEVVRSNNPTPEEGGDIVADIGGEFNGVDRFDHHQNSPEVAGKCAAELVCQSFFPELMADKEFGEFVKMLSFMDNNGPINTAKQYAVEIGTFNSLMLITRGMVKLFESQPQVVAEMMATIVQDKLNFLAEVKAAKEHYNCPGVAEVVDINGVKCLNINVPFEGSAPAANKGQEEIIKENKIDIVHSVDIRDKDNKTLFRTYNGELKGLVLTPNLVSDAKFCHKAGFMLNYKPADKDEWRRAVSLMS